MRVVFRKRAEADLRGIVAWYEQVAPDSLKRILDDIYRSIDILMDSPGLGMPIEGTRFRRIVTRRYHFKIAYEPTRENILIVGIYRFQNRST
jgi:plasmid stabilization system protein ParE